MAHVVFAFGSKPELTERQALQVADALTAQRNLAAQSAAKKLRDQVRVNVDADETSNDLDLEPEELVELAGVMNEIRWPDDEPAYEYLRRQALNSTDHGAASIAPPHLPSTRTPERPSPTAPQPTPVDSERAKRFNDQLRVTVVRVGGASADGHEYGFLCECGCGETVMLVLADYDLQGGAWLAGHHPTME